MLTFLKVYDIVKNRRIGLYKCSCGNLMTARISSVNYGHTKSCGCLKSKNIKKINLKKRISNER